MYRSPDWRKMRAGSENPRRRQDEHWTTARPGAKIANLMIPMLEEFFATKSMGGLFREGQRPPASRKRYWGTGEVLISCHLSTRMRRPSQTEQRSRGCSRIAAGFYCSTDSGSDIRTPGHRPFRDDGVLSPALVDDDGKALWRPAARWRELAHADAFAA